MLSIALALSTFVIVYGEYDCWSIQQCLYRESKNCWGKYHSEAVQRGPDDVISLVMKMVSADMLMEMASGIEHSFEDKLMQIDYKLMDCMDGLGHKNGSDYCANMRPMNHKVNEPLKIKVNKDASECWEEAVDACENGLLDSDDVNGDLATCMKAEDYDVSMVEGLEDVQGKLSLTRWETLVGHQVGATVMKALGEKEEVKKLISVLTDVAAGQSSNEL